MNKKHSEENNEQDPNVENSELNESAPEVPEIYHPNDDDDDDDELSEDEAEELIQEPHEILTEQQLADDAREEEEESFPDNIADIDTSEMSYNDNEFEEKPEKPASKPKKKAIKKSNKKAKAKVKTPKVVKIKPDEEGSDPEAAASEQNEGSNVEDQADEPIVPKTERRTLRYTFNDKEMHDLSIKLAMGTKSLQALEEEKSSVVAQYGSKIKQAKANCNVLSNLVADGWEFREIDVTIEYHKPAQGQKTIKRTDTGEEIVEKMDAYEFNLFNQPTENE